MKRNNKMNENGFNNTRATIKDVAVKANVSLSTVSRALREPDKTPAETVSKVRAAAEALNYVYNATAGSLSKRRSDTIGILRVDYLHKMQRVYESEIGRMQDMIDHSTNVREVAAATKRKEKLQKQLKECREYDEMIGHLALSRIELDLDDGVKVNYEKIQTASDGKKYPVLAKI